MSVHDDNCNFICNIWNVSSYYEWSLNKKIILILLRKRIIIILTIISTIIKINNNIQNNIYFILSIIN